MLVKKSIKRVETGEGNRDQFRAKYMELSLNPDFNVVASNLMISTVKDGKNMYDYFIYYDDYSPQKIPEQLEQTQQALDKTAQEIKEKTTSNQY